MAASLLLNFSVGPRLASSVLRTCQLVRSYNQQGNNKTGLVNRQLIVRQRIISDLSRCSQIKSAIDQIDQTIRNPKHVSLAVILSIRFDKEVQDSIIKIVDGTVFRVEKIDKDNVPANTLVQTYIANQSIAIYQVEINCQIDSPADMTQT